MYVITQPRAALGSVQYVIVPRPRALAVRRVRRPSHTLGSVGTQIGKQAGTQAATIAVAAIPVVGPFLAPFVGLFTGLFGKHHQEAVIKEGQTLNVNSPNFLVAVQDAINALNAGQISESAAISALNQAQDSYYSSVSGIIKKGGPCTYPCGPGDYHDKYGCCNKSGKCNAACCIGCNIIEPAVKEITKIIQAGGGSYTVPATPDHGAIAGTPSFTVSYTRGAGGILGGNAGGVPMWVWLAGGGVLLVLLLMMMRR